VSTRPDGGAGLVHHGHEVVVESGAGKGSGFVDKECEAAGARIAEGPDELFEAADLVVKIKEPVPEEYDRFHEGQELSLEVRRSRPWTQRS
jgi:alanine dehydrogenase